jgi:hypothetical protein
MFRRAEGSVWRNKFSRLDVLEIVREKILIFEEVKV